MSPSPTSRTVPSRVRVPAVFVGTLLATSPCGASLQSLELDKYLGDARESLDSPASSVRESLQKRFDRLLRRWREETQFVSSTTEIAVHPAYQAIIGMGPAALPMILEDLRTNGGHWFWALKAVSDEDPVPAADRGVVSKMTTAWLRWGEQKGITTA